MSNDFAKELKNVLPDVYSDQYFKKLLVPERYPSVIGGGWGKKVFLQDQYIVACEKMDL